MRDRGRLDGVLAWGFLSLAAVGCDRDRSGNGSGTGGGGGGSSHSSTGSGAGFVVGKNRYTLTLEGDTREYFVHVPTSYSATVATPIVFMLHGAGGTGEQFYGQSGWVEVGEAENVLTVFPSSWTYPCVLDDGMQKQNREKWASYNLVLCDAGDHPRDDIGFIARMLDELEAQFNVDDRRVYMVGFSNGGEMASRAVVELGDRLAAGVSAAGGLDTAHTPKREGVPFLFQQGNADPHMKAKLGTTSDLPMDFGPLLADGSPFRNFIQPFLDTLAMKPGYSVGGNAAKYLTATYQGQSGLADNVFGIFLVNGLGHAYPNGDNHPMKAAEEHWAWLRAYALP